MMKKLLGIVVLGLLLPTNSFSADRIELVCTMYEYSSSKDGTSSYGPYDDVLILDLENRLVVDGVWHGGGILTKITNQNIYAEPRADQFSDGNKRSLSLNRYTGKLRTTMIKTSGERITWAYDCKPAKKIF